MNLSPPTDNLYKFGSIAALLFLIFAVTWPSIRTQEIREKRSQWQVDRAIAEVERRIAAEKRARIKSAKTPAEVEKRTDDAVQSDADARKHLAAVEAKSEYFNQLNIDYWVSYVLVCVGAAIGGGGSVFLFFLWYFKVQKHLDAMTVWDAEKARRELNAALSDTVKPGGEGI